MIKNQLAVATAAAFLAAGAARGAPDALARRVDDSKCIIESVPESAKLSLMRSQARREKDAPEEYRLAVDKAIRTCAAAGNWSEERGAPAVWLAVAKLSANSARGVVELEGFDPALADQWWQKQTREFQTGFGTPFMTKAATDAYIDRIVADLFAGRSLGDREKKQVSAIGGYFMMKTAVERQLAGLPLN